MSNGWTLERRARQSVLIHTWKPWKLAGVKTLEGKAISKMNAYKHGARCADIRNIMHQLAELKRCFKQMEKFS